MLDYFGKVSPGSWPDWVAAVFTSLAFVVAAFSYRRSVEVRRESQARLVYSKITRINHYDVGSQLEVLPDGAQVSISGGGTAFVLSSSPESKPREVAVKPVIQVTAVIHNGSQELIGPGKLQIVDVGLRRVYDTFALRVGLVEPGSDYVVSVTFPNEAHPGQPSLGVTLLFRDASGQWWRRHLADPIEAVHDDPENYAGTPTERAIWARNARAMGLEPSPDPKASLRARWHRFWRKRAGKSPTP